MADKQTEMLRERYYFESERQGALSARLGLPIVILTLVFGGVTYYVKNFGVLGPDLWSTLFYIMFALTLVSLALAIHFAVRSFYNYGYAYPPLPSDVADDIDKIRGYYEDPYFEDYDKDYKEALIGREIESLIAGYYRACLEINIPNNNKKSKYLHRSSSALIAVIIFLFLSSVPFWKRYHSVTRVEKVQIVECAEEGTKMSDDEKQDQKPPKPPPKPEPTRVQIIKEHKEKPEAEPKGD